MERAYQREHVRVRSYTPAARGRSTQKEFRFSRLSRILFQLFTSAVLFALVYASQFYSTPFFDRVKNEAEYTLNYTVSLESAYKSSREFIQYLSGKIAAGEIYVKTDEQPQSDVYSGETAPPSLTPQSDGA